MNFKSILKLFIPPILYKIKNKIIKKKDLKKNTFSEKEVAYNYIFSIAKRSVLPFTDIYKLSEEFSFKEISSISTTNLEPNFYGNFWILQNYAKIPIKNFPPKNFSIQHGIVIELSQYDIHRGKDVSLVWSNEIKKKMDLLDLNTSYVIGAPFLYADSILTEQELYEEKKRLGYNVLAFPMHSTHFVDKEFDPRNFLKILHNEKKRFDSVRICLYWKDIQQGKAKLYIDEGFEVVCAGHMFDQFFLQRQKSLFKIADATISNGLGSHIGYSLIENRPHCIVSDDYFLKDVVGNDGKEEMRLLSNSKDYFEILSQFENNIDYKITSSQNQIIDKWWGVSNMLTEKDMYNLIMRLYEN